MWEVLEHSSTFSFCWKGGEEIGYNKNIKDIL